MSHDLTSIAESAVFDAGHEAPQAKASRNTSEAPRPEKHHQHAQHPHGTLATVAAASDKATQPDGRLLERKVSFLDVLHRRESYRAAKVTRQAIVTFCFLESSLFQ